MNQPAPPFSCSYNPQLPELLNKLNCTLVISTYQASKVIFISAVDDERLVQLPRNFVGAMGIAMKDDKMAIATKDEVVVLKNSPKLAPTYPRKPATYDALFMPRATYYTGHVDVHDLHFGQQGLYAVNTSFSCLCLINDEYSFEPIWKPGFITEYASEDRCHLNGLAMENDMPKYISGLGRSNVAQGWRENIVAGGFVMDIATGELVMDRVPMPHSPRLYDGKLFMLLSATGELVQADVNTGKYTVITRFKGFARGMAKHGDYLFVALSKLRQNSSTFRHLPIALDAKEAGIVVVHLPTGATVGQITYQASVDEIYDLQVIPNSIRPGILNTEGMEHKLGLSIPGATYWAVVQPTDAG